MAGSVAGPPGRGPACAWAADGTGLGLGSGGRRNDLAKAVAGPGRDEALAALHGRTIATGPHCYGCTAGAGSSCRGALA